MQSSQNSDSSGSRLVWHWKGKGFSIPISQWDVLKLAQAVNEEGYPELGVAWALIQRVAWLRTMGIRTTLGELAQDYAQPINPDWFPTGHRHESEVKRLRSLGDEAGALAEIGKAKRRPAKANAAWEDLKPLTRDIITRIMEGKSASPVIGAVHYWASRAPDFAGNQARKPNLILLDRGYGFGPGRNVFFAQKGSEDFTVFVVRDGSNAPLLSGTGKAGKIIAGLISGYLAWKWFS